MKRLALSAALVLLTLTAHASVVTSLSGATALPIPNRLASGSDGAQNIASGITWESNNSQSVFGYSGSYGFDSNNNWEGLTMIGLNSAPSSDTMTISFSTPVAGFGGLLNYAPGHGTATIAVYDLSRTLIESKILNFTVTDVNRGVFLGFLENTSKISYFTMSGAFIGGTNFEVLTSVPEPETYAMLMAGLGLMGIAARRRTQT